MKAKNLIKTCNNMTAVIVHTYEGDVITFSRKGFLDSPFTNHTVKYWHFSVQGLGAESLVVHLNGVKRKKVKK